MNKVYLLIEYGDCDTDETDTIIDIFTLKTHAEEALTRYSRCHIVEHELDRYNPLDYKGMKAFDISLDKEGTILSIRNVEGVYFEPLMYFDMVYDKKYREIPNKYKLVIFGIMADSEENAICYAKNHLHNCLRDRRWPRKGTKNPKAYNQHWQEIRR